MPASYMALVQVLDALFLSQLPADGLRRQQRKAQSLCPCTHVGDLDKTLGSWLWTGLAPAVAVIWGVYQGLNDLSVSFLFSLLLCLSNKNKVILNKKVYHGHCLLLIFIFTFPFLICLNFCYCYILGYLILNSVIHNFPSPCRKLHFNNLSNLFSWLTHLSPTCFCTVLLYVSILWGIRRKHRSIFLKCTHRKMCWSKIMSLFLETLRH